MDLLTESRDYFLSMVLSVLGVSLSQWSSGPPAEESSAAGFAPDFSQCVNVPKQCPNKNITYWHYTRETKNNPFELDLTNFKDAPYQDGVPFVILIHGYTGWKDYAPNPELRAALFDQGEYNIISVDYNPIAKEPCYVQAAYNVKTVANCTTRLLLEMIDSLPQIINLDNLHIIGFSLGAQVAGNMGHYFKTLGGVTVKWMTGLDPALPLFDSVLVSADSRLSEDDAEFLDVYHTNAGNKGIVRPQGKVDFYFNNAYNQPGCGSNSSCDHYRAVLYYGESISRSSPGFWGASCKLTNLISYFTSSIICEAPSGENQLVEAGFYGPHSTRGTYQIGTNSKPPFAMGKKPPQNRRRSIFGW